MSPEGSAGITFLSAPPVFILLIILAGTGVLLFFLYRRFSVPAPWKLRGFLAALRIFLVLLSIWMLMDPYHSQPNESEWLGVLVDSSKSMSIRDEGAEDSRWEQARIYFQKDGFWNSLQKDKLRHFAAFDSETRETESLTAIKPEGSASKLITAVREIDSRYRGDADLLGWIAFTDGAATDAPAAPKPLVESSSFPWILVGTGFEGPVPNVHLQMPALSEPVFAGDEVAFRIPWTANFPADVTSKLTVSINGKNLWEKKVTLSQGAMEEKWVPSEPGDYFFDIAIEPVSGEGSFSDNSVRAAVRVHSRQVNVFYAESFYKDKNFFKDALEEDPAFEVDFVSSLIGFSRKNQVPFIKDQIHGLPRTREAMLDYDAIVLSDVKRDLLTQDQMEWIRELVEKEGGALIMVGGVDSFGDGGYVAAPLEQMLPVEISEEYKQKVFLKARGINESPFRAVIPPGAETHPVLKLGNSPEENESFWQNMPLLGGYNYVGRVKAGATLLLQHPSDTSEFGPRAILAVQNFGMGKVLAFTSDVTPNWGQWFQEWQDKKKGWLYAQFWRGALKWLTENKLRRELQDFAITQEPALAESQIPMTWKLNVPKPQSSDLTVNVSILKPDGAVIQSESFKDMLQPEAVWTTSPLMPGDYKIRAVYSLKGKVIFENEKPFAVHEPRIESLHLASRHTLLQRLAEETKGVYLPMNKIQDLDKAIAQMRKTLLKKRSIPFWNHPLVYLVILAVLCVDWFVRKKRGLE